MKTTVRKSEGKQLPTLIVSYDVSKFKNDYYSEFESKNDIYEIDGIVKNKTDELDKHLDDIEKIKVKHGFLQVKIVCEATGGYEKLLINRARKRNYLVEYVNGEATNKYKVIQSNDAGKNDKKDAQIIHSLAKDGKTIVCRLLPDEYQVLQYLNRKYEWISVDESRKKVNLSSAVEEIFPGLSIKAKEFYTVIIRVVIRVYGLNPYLIGNQEYEDFEKKLSTVYKRKICSSQQKLLKKVWKSAKEMDRESRNKLLVKEQMTCVKEQLRKFEQLEKEKAEYRKKILAIFEQTVEYSKLKDSTKGLFALARVIAETGPLSAFGTIEQLIRYAGLNLIEKQSGAFKGQIRISKKGNVLLRKVLGQLAWSVYIRKVDIYGEYYHLQKSRKNGTYALTCTMRKLMKMFFGIYRSKQDYCEARVLDQSVFKTKSA